MTPKPKRKREEPDPSLIVTSKRRKLVPLSVTKVYYQSPSYTKCGDMCGGCHSTVVLGPRAYREQNSDADPKKPTGILKAREKYPQCSFKAGHLLNATLGGSGTDSNNLLILTASANVKCNTFDNKLKNALIHLGHIYGSLSRFYVDIAKVNYGIKVDIIVDKSSNWGPTPPDSYIHKTMHMKAAVWGSLDLNNLVDSGGEKVVLNESQKSEVQGHIGSFKSAVGEAADFTVTNSK